jgi:hypothetical protein
MSSVVDPGDISQDEGAHGKEMVDDSRERLSRVSSKQVSRTSSPVADSSTTTPIPVPDAVPKCFRISGIPLSWSENDLFDALHTVDPSLTLQNYRPSLYPSCYGPTQTVLLNLHPSTVFLQSLNHFSFPESASRTAAALKIDSDFYNLTPLNVPTGEVVAEFDLPVPAKVICGC